MIETLKFQSHAQQLTFEIEKIYLEAKQMLLESPLDERAKRYAEFLGKLGELYKKFKEEQLVTYKALHPAVQKRRRAISSHLPEL